MKSIILITIISSLVLLSSFNTINNKNLKTKKEKTETKTKSTNCKNDPNTPVETGVDPGCVKSPGEFSNVAPEAKSVKTPKYANPKLQIVAHVDKYNEPVSRLEWFGTTAVPGSSKRFDYAATTFGKEQADPYVSRPGDNLKTMYANTISRAKTTTIHPVMLDLKKGGEHLPTPNNAKLPKAFHGEVGK